MSIWKLQFATDVCKCVQYVLILNVQKVDSAATHLLWSHHYYVSACTMGVCKYSYAPCGSTTVLALSSPPLVKGR